MTPDQITKYFVSTDYHPKYNQIDTHTKYFYEELINRVKRHKIGEGDRGMKTVEEICLPKPPTDLKYITVEGVPGKVIYPRCYKKPLWPTKEVFLTKQRTKHQKIQFSCFYVNQLFSANVKMSKGVPS